MRFAFGRVDEFGMMGQRVRANPVVARWMKS